MAIKKIPLPSFSRVAAGSKAICELPIGPTYLRLLFEATGADNFNDYGKIAVVVNGTTRIEHKDLQRLAFLNAFYNRGIDTFSEWCIHFDRQEFDQMVERLAPGFGTADLQTLSVEIELPSGSSITALKATAEIETQPQPLGVYTAIKETSLSSSVTGEVEYDRLQKGDRVYQAIHFFKADINKVNLKADSYEIIDCTKAQLERFQKNTRPVARVPQTAVATHVDFNGYGNSADLLKLQGVQDVRFKLTFGSIGTVDIVTEELTNEY